MRDKKGRFIKGQRNSIATEFKKGIHCSSETEFKKGFIPWNKGKKLPQLSGENNPFYGKHHTKEAREKMSEKQKNEKNNMYGKHNPNAIIAMNKARRGSHHTEESKKKISEAMKRKYIGAGNPNWKGGISVGENRKKYRSFMQKRREIRKKGNGGSHTFGDWGRLKAQYNWTCPFCEKKEPEIRLTEDHIIPLSKGGSDNIENIQPLCGRCNFQKHTKIGEEFKGGVFKL